MELIIALVFGVILGYYTHLKKRQYEVVEKMYQLLFFILIFIIGLTLDITVFSSYSVFMQIFLFTLLPIIGSVLAVIILKRGKLL